MNLRDYEKLIKIYDSMDQITELQKILFGEEFAIGFDNGLIGVFSNVEDILRDNMHEKYKHDEHVDFFQREWYIILADKSKSARERAEILLCG